MDDKLYVIAVISNPQQFKARYKLYREFAQYMRAFSNIEFYTVEMAFAGRAFEVTEEGNPYHIRVRGNQEYWVKESLINIGISKLPHHARKIAWIDADIKFLNPNWVQDTLDALDHYKFVQMFSEYIDLGPKGEVIAKANGFVNTWKNALEVIINPTYGKATKGATGLAWAGTREAIEAIGGIPDYTITGAGDFYLAYSLIGEAESVRQPWFTSGYNTLFDKLKHDCDEYVQKCVGFVNGLAVHYWHGPKSKRGYGWRERILNEHRYDPIMDLKRDSQGLYIVNSKKQEMLRDLHEYFISRDEDINVQI